MKRILSPILGCLVIVAFGAVPALARSQSDETSDIIVPDVEISAPVDGRIAGEPNAPITVLEWGDYQ